MQAYELIIAVRKASESRTKEQRAELLREAHILDANGYYMKGFFSSETIKKDKASFQGR